MLKVILGLVLIASLAGTINAQSEAPSGAGCGVTTGYLQLCLQYGACIMGDCASWEFEGTYNNQWLEDYWYPFNSYGEPVEQRELSW